MIGKLHRDGNSSFIARSMTKIRDSTSVDDVRPISLIGRMAKAVLKILAPRFKYVILSLIDGEQTAWQEHIRRLSHNQ